MQQVAIWWRIETKSGTWINVDDENLAEGPEEKIKKDVAFKLKAPHP
jgi:RNase P/RNase MRP subunit p29